LVIVRDGLEICVEHFHVLGEKYLTVVHGHDRFIATDLDDDTAFVVPKGKDVGVLW
jgi:hypothetical protein